MRTILFAALSLGLSSAAVAQDAAPLPLQVARVDQPRYALPANTEVLLSMNQEVTTKGKTWDEGDNFDMSVVQDVTFGDYVVIPKGSHAVGKITWLTSKGAFGKSGKMDVSLEYVEVGGRRIPVEGTYRQEGEGNTVATIGGVILAGVFAGFITGKSGRIPQGRELMAHTKDDIPLAIEGSVQAERPLAVHPVAAQPVQQASLTVSQPEAPTATVQPVSQSNEGSNSSPTNTPN